MPVIRARIHFSLLPLDSFLSTKTSPGGIPNVDFVRFDVSAILKYLQSFSIHYSFSGGSSAPPWPPSNLRQKECRCEPVPLPFCEKCGRRAFTSVRALAANIFLGSSGSVSSQRLVPKTQNVPQNRANVVPNEMIKMRGGKDFFSATVGTSRTFTVGISLAS